ncbi:hypothetical protein H310_04822 [Aphanomyces invadans]|uniref:Uncharacterized protein n=1 Tax=Aphanomyces invadans TaxID=157072 RepID=A0A024UCG9_9STRA|nr:hypothetical protein H310_04822 [Aphanomyces invadans]ETW03328.1 hypothetical protein H310_04822 [Aphanomyces invadans]|eukprot:XP_008867557.1 hypothetical protein H310_04822 [Aphanomyces invadans]
MTRKGIGWRVGRRCRRMLGTIRTGWDCARSLVRSQGALSSLNSFVLVLSAILAAVAEVVACVNLASTRAEVVPAIPIKERHAYTRDFFFFAPLDRGGRRRRGVTATQSIHQTFNGVQNDPRWRARLCLRSCSGHCWVARRIRCHGEVVGNSGGIDCAKVLPAIPL